MPLLNRPFCAIFTGKTKNVMFGIHFNPLNAASPFFNGYDPYDDDDDCCGPDDLRRRRDSLRIALLHVFSFFVLMLVLLGIIALLTGCSTVKESSYQERHKMETIVDRLDSLSRQRTVIQQDSTWRQEILRQFQSIRERSDTSHVVVQDTAGNVIREKIVINNTREVTSETDREQLTVMSHRLEQMDSTISLMRHQLQHSDSLLQASQERVVREVKSPLTFWQNLQLWAGRAALLILALLAAIFFIKKRIVK